MRIHAILFIFVSIVLKSWCGAGTYTDSLKVLLTKEIPLHQRIEALDQLSANYFSTNMDSARFYINKAVRLVREKGNNNDKAKIYRTQGFLLYNQGKYMTALEILDLAESFLADDADKNIKADIFYFKGLTYAALHNYDKAFIEAERAMEVHNNNNNLKGKYIIYCFLSLLYDDLGDEENGMRYLQKSTDIILQLEDSSALGANYNNMGCIFLELKNYDSAKYYFQKSIHLSPKYRNHKWLGSSYQNIAEIFLSSNQNDSADYYIQKAIELFDKTGSLSHNWSAMEVKARIALAISDTSKALKIFNQIINAGETNENLESKARALNGIFKIYLYSNRPDSALYFSRQYQIVSDSLIAAKYTSLLSVLKLKQEYESKHDKLELENQRVKLTSQRKNLYLIVLSGVLLLLIITIYYFSRLQKSKAKSIRLEKKQLEQKLEFQNKELATNVMSLMKKNEILTTIANKLLVVEKEATKQEVKKAIHKLSKEIQKTTDKEIWDEFELRFNQVHVEFHDNLMKEFPDLSPNEQRLCAFLRLNMSTKDISNLTGQTPKAIDIARFRLRKKLGISNSDINLITFLSKF